MLAPSPRALLLASTLLGAALPAAARAQAQAQPPAQTPAAVEEVVVTGSRIPRADLTAPQPVTILGGESIRERGFTNLADAINQMPAAGVPINPIGDQNDFGTGRNYINLFNLGTNRTLTLVNGRRFVGDNPINIFASEPGNQVDINNLPTLFVERIEEVPATGAAVYGSDAVAGVVNIIMRKRFEGAQFIAQAGVSGHRDAQRYTTEVALGHSWDKLNVAIDVQLDRTSALLYSQRPGLAAGYRFVPNPADTGPNDNVPGSILISNSRFPTSTAGGLAFTAAGDPILLPGTTTQAQFGPGGNLVAFDPGVLYGGGLYASGGEGLNLAPLTALQTPVNRKVGELIASYEFTPHLRLEVSAFVSDNKSTEPVNQPNYSDIAFGISPPGSPIAGLAFTVGADNPFLTPQARAVLAANGADEFVVSRSNIDLSPDPIRSSVRTHDVSLNLVGDFHFLDRAFNWNLAWLQGSSRSSFHQDNIIFGNPDVGVGNRFGYALDAVTGPNGQPICRVTLENPGSQDIDIATCVPLNPFGVGNASEAALRYVTADFGNSARNLQSDIQFNIGGDVVTLPAGVLRVSLGYEHRSEKASFEPSLASAQGIGYSVPIQSQSGRYATDEYYLETLVPVLGSGFSLPFARRLELEAAYRRVDNSIAGKNEAWSYGGRFSPVDDVTFRGSRSKTFRAPALTELFAGQTSAFDLGTDPCTTSNIIAGPNPSVRQANCAAAFQAVGANLANFSSSIIEAQTIPVTAGGNPNLTNEIGESWTYGLVVQPRWTPGLSLTADYVHIDINNAIEFFGLTDLLAGCYDNPTYPASPCALFQRDANGQVTTAAETFVNAGYTHFAGMTYALTYDRDVAGLPFVHSNADLGRVGLTVNLANTRRQITSFSGLGFDATNYAGLIGYPRWRGLASLRYSRGPFRGTWTTRYVGPAKYNLTFTNENRSILGVSQYYAHDLSLEYRIRPWLSARLNVNNITDEKGPFPQGIGNNLNGGYTQTYDQIGRFFILGLEGRF